MTVGVDSVLAVMVMDRPSKGRYVLALSGSISSQKTKGRKQAGELEERAVRAAIVGLVGAQSQSYSHSKRTVSP